LWRLLCRLTISGVSSDLQSAAGLRCTQTEGARFIYFVGQMRNRASTGQWVFILALQFSVSFEDPVFWRWSCADRCQATLAPLRSLPSSKVLLGISRLDVHVEYRR
jgi:hypothetical protein